MPANGECVKKTPEITRKAVAKNETHNPKLPHRSHHLCELIAAKEWVIKHRVLLRLLGNCGEYTRWNTHRTVSANSLLLAVRKESETRSTSAGDCIEMSLLIT